MLIEIDKLERAINKVKVFAEGTSTVPGILFDFRGDELRVCYSDNKKAIMEKITGIIYNDGEPSCEARIVLGFNRLISIMDMSKSSGDIKTEYMSIVINENNTVDIEVVKTMLVRRAIDNEAEEVEYVEEPKVVSKLSQTIGYNYTSDNLRYQILDRTKYDEIAKKIASADGDASADEWSSEELSSILARLASKKGRTVYVSSQVGGGFTVNNTYVTYTPTELEIANGFAISSSVAKSLVTVLNDIEENVFILREDRYIYMTDETENVSIWMEMAPASKTDLSTLKSYENHNYESYQLVFSKAAIVNALDCALYSSKEDKLKLKFNDVDDIKSLVIENKEMGAFNVSIEGRIEGVNSWESLKELEASISLKSMKEMISDCTSVYVGMDLQIDEKGNKFIRIGELLGRDENGDKLYNSKYYTIVGK